MAMGNGTSIGKFNGLTTAGGGLFFDVGALLRNACFLSRNPAALIGSPDALSFNPEVLSFDPDALSRDPDGLSFNPDPLKFNPDALRFDVFRQERCSNGLFFNRLRWIGSNCQKSLSPKPSNSNHPSPMNYG
jgi:hypothetical protein